MTKWKTTPKTELFTKNYYWYVANKYSHSNWVTACMKEIDFCGQYFLLRLVFPFVVFPYMIQSHGNNLFFIFSHATFKLLKFLRWFQTFQLIFYTQSYYSAEPYPILIHCWIISYHDTLWNYAPSQYLAVDLAHNRKCFDSHSDSSTKTLASQSESSITTTKGTLQLTAKMDERSRFGLPERLYRLSMQSIFNIFSPFWLQWKVLKNKCFPKTILRKSL